MDFGKRPKQEMSQFGKELYIKKKKMMNQTRKVWNSMHKTPSYFEKIQQ